MNDNRLSLATKAKKEALPAKVALAGPAGSGKTFSAIMAAEVFACGGRILVIDTERRSASLYADLADFDTLDWWPPYDPRALAVTIQAAAQTYAVIIIDSLSHFWFGEGGTLDIVDDAATRMRGNSFVGWKEGTPAQEGMYEAILAAPCHVICCIRSKTEYVLEVDSRGKQVPRKVGMAPVQRDGVEYQFTVQMDMDFEHSSIVGKTRCPALSEKVFRKGDTKEWARILLDWLNSGEAAPVVPCPVDGCTRTARTKVEHVPHLVADHGWWLDDNGKVHPPAVDEPQPPASAPPSAEHAPDDDGHDLSAGAGPTEAGVAGPSAPASGPSPKQLGMIHGLLTKLGVPDDDRHAYVSTLLDIAPVASMKDLSKQQTRALIDVLVAEAEPAPTGGAS